VLSARKHPARNEFNSYSLVLSWARRRQLNQPDYKYKAHTKFNLGRGVTLAAGPSWTIPTRKRNSSFSRLCDSTKLLRLLERAPSLLLSNHQTAPLAVTPVPSMARIARTRTRRSVPLTVTLFPAFAPYTSPSGTIELPPHLLERVQEFLRSVPSRHVAVKQWYQLLGEFRSTSLAIPRGMGMFSHLREVHHINDKSPPLPPCYRFSLSVQARAKSLQPITVLRNKNTITKTSLSDGRPTLALGKIVVSTLQV
jgi:hypothetical protein